MAVSCWNMVNDLMQTRVKLLIRSFLGNTGQVQTKLHVNTPARKVLYKSHSVIRLEIKIVLQNFAMKTICLFNFFICFASCFPCLQLNLPPSRCLNWLNINVIEGVPAYTQYFRHVDFRDILPAMQAPDIQELQPRFCCCGFFSTLKVKLFKHFKPTELKTQSWHYSQ